MIKSLLKLFDLSAPISVQNSENKNTPLNGIKIFIEHIQLDAWKSSGMEFRLKDPTYPYSGLFDPPPEIEDVMATTIQLAGMVIPRPVITSAPITSIYQEKICYPFVNTAWSKLLNNIKMDIDFNLGEKIHFATVLTGKVYPSIFHDSISDEYAIIFDANILLFHIFSFGVLSSICKIPKQAKHTSNGYLGDKSLWFGDYTFERSLSELKNYKNEISLLSKILKNLVVHNQPIPGDQFDYSILEPNLLVAHLIDDLFVYLLSHELAHISGEHFQGIKGDNIPNWDKSIPWQEERWADFFGFSKLVQCNQTRGGNFSLYIHVNIFFHIMSYLYRTINFLNNKREDYGILPDDVLFKVYFPGESFYPHPLGRLYYFRREIRSKSTELPRSIDAWDKKIDTFFDNLWRLISINLIKINEPVSSVWKEIIDLHYAAKTSQLHKDHKII